MKTLFLTRKDIEQIVDIREAISSIEYVFKLYGEGKTIMPPKTYIHLKDFNGDFRSMSAYVPDLRSCVLKWINVHPDNKKFDMPAVMGIIIINDPEKGFPLCIMDGTHPTMLRTAAAGGVAAKYLARPDSQTIGLVGCGTQAYSQLLALNELFQIENVIIWGDQETIVELFIKKTANLNLTMKTAASPDECVRGCDIVVTTTPSRNPLVKLESLAKGVHINAIGADARGKEELDPEILKHAKVVIDSWEQASHSGEINVPLRKKILTQKNIYANIGEIVTGQKPARENKDEITVFDSTGLAIQDVAIAHLIYNKALDHNVGLEIDIVGSGKEDRVVIE